MSRQFVGNSATVAAVRICLSCSLPRCWASPAQAAVPLAIQARSFEGVLGGAIAAPRPDALVAPFAEDCAKARREIDRARCRGAQTFLRGRLPDKLLHAVVDSARVVSVSEYDAGVRGYRVRLLGCLTCDDPVPGPEGESRYVTFAVPGKDAASLREAVVMANTTLGAGTPDEIRAFEAAVKPHLRAEYVFRGDGTAWSHGGRKGVAFTPVAMRIFNRCTGDVIFSKPASERKVDVVEGLKGCAPEAPVASAAGADRVGAKAGPNQAGKADKEGTADAPEKLGASEINTALHATRRAIAACDAQYQKPGAIELEFDLSGTGGAAQAVRAKGNLGGTPIANCLLDAVREAQFPRFRQSRQTFSYQVRLGATR